MTRMRKKKMSLVDGHPTISRMEYQLQLPGRLRNISALNDKPRRSVCRAPSGAGLKRAWLGGMLQRANFFVNRF